MEDFGLTGSIDTFGGGMDTQLTMGTWRGRLESMSLLLSTTVLLTTLGLYLGASAGDDSDFVVQIRGWALLGGLGLPVIAYVALALVILPRAFLRWPADTPMSVASWALVMGAVASIASGSLHLIAAIGHITELNIDRFDRESGSLTAEVWGGMLTSGSASIAAAGAAVAAVMAWLALRRTNSRPQIEPEFVPPAS